MADILIDLSILKHPNCGLGQVALNYGYYFRDRYVPVAGEHIDLLVPQTYVGAFGDKVGYRVAHHIYRVLPWLMHLRRYDVWHAMHQLSRYRPWAKHVVLTIHDYNFVYEKSPEKAAKYLRKIQQKVNGAERLCAISRFTRDEVLRYSDTLGRNVEVIYNGIERIDLLPESKPSQVGEEPFLFTIGEIKEKKNFAVLLDMMKFLPQYRLYMAGKDTTPYAAEIRRRIAQEKINNVVLLGTVSTAQKVWLYRHCKAFVFPSLFEGFGLPVVEAMLFGKPVLCSHETSLSEIGGEQVTFFEKGYPAKVCAHQIQLAIESQTDAQRDKAIRYARSYTWDHHLEQYLKIYRSIAQ